MWHTTCNYDLLENILHSQNGVLLLTFSTDVWLSDRFKILVCFVEIAIRKCTKKYVSKIYRKNPGKEFIIEKSSHSSGDSGSVTTGIGGAFSVWPNITPQKSLLTDHSN